MSTRSQIKLLSKDFKGCSEAKIYIYKHSDGYPEGVIPTLYPFVNYFQANRGCNDGSYLLAQIVRYFALNDYKYEQSNEKYYPEAQKGFLTTTGWGLDCEEHGDVEFLYEIGSDGSIYINGKKQTETQLKKYCKEA